MKRIVLAVALIHAQVVVRDGVVVSYNGTPYAVITQSPTPEQPKQTPTPPTAYERMTQKLEADRSSLSACLDRWQKNADAWAETWKRLGLCPTTGPDVLKNFARCHALLDPKTCEEEYAEVKADEFWLTSHDAPTPTPTPIPAPKRRTKR